MTQWSVYIVRCRDGTLYTGIATDVRRRIAEHARNQGRGAKYLRGRGPLKLVFVRAIGARGTALRVESRIKKLPKARKEALVGAREKRRRAPRATNNAMVRTCMPGT
jgi:putative endonuclease